jgi:hypothetical protein
MILILLDSAWASYKSTMVECMWAPVVYSMSGVVVPSGSLGWVPVFWSRDEGTACECHLGIQASCVVWAHNIVTEIVVGSDMVSLDTVESN